MTDAEFKSLFDRILKRATLVLFAAGVSAFAVVFVKEILR